MLQQRGVTSQLAASLEEGGRRDLTEPLLASPRDSKSGGHGLVGLQRGLHPRSIGQLAFRLARSRLGLQLLTIAACISWMSASSWAILVNKVRGAVRFPVRGSREGARRHDTPHRRGPMGPRWPRVRMPPLTYRNLQHGSQQQPQSPGLQPAYASFQQHQRLVSTGVTSSPR